MAAKTEKSETVETPKTEPVGTKSYKVISNLRHGDKFYAPDKTVELSAEDAKTLKALNVIESE
jgi:hypothetical protein